MYIVVEQQNQWYFLKKETEERRKKQKQKLVKQNLVKNFSVSRYSVKCEDHYCQVSSFRFFGNVFGYDKWKNTLQMFTDKQQIN